MCHRWFGYLQLTDAAFKHLSKHCHQLKTLNINRCAVSFVLSCLYFGRVASAVGWACHQQSWLQQSTAVHNHKCT